MLKLGSKVGHILVTEFLAKGGMGNVYAGYDERLGRRVALKAIRTVILRPWPGTPLSRGGLFGQNPY